MSSKLVVTPAKRVAHVAEYGTPAGQGDTSRDCKHIFLISSSQHMSSYLVLLQ